MKTKIFKTGLPIMAFLMAIGFAFATQNKTEDTLIPEYIVQNGCTLVTRGCNNMSTKVCKLGTDQVFGWNQTTCNQVLFHSLPN